jgi:hypothetical protein
MKSNRAPTDPTTATMRVRLQLCGKITLTRNPKKRKVVRVNPRDVRKKLYAIRARKVIPTLFQESG